VETPKKVANFVMIKRVGTMTKRDLLTKVIPLRPDFCSITRTTRRLKGGNELVREMGWGNTLGAVYGGRSRRVNQIGTMAVLFHAHVSRAASSARKSAGGGAVKLSLAPVMG
jgi:hypothetical protein